MLRVSLALAIALCGVASGAAPSYSASDIVNVGNYAAGPFAPGSILSLFGSDLASSERALRSDDIRDNQLPIELNSTRVYVDDIPAPLFYISPKQINFLVPVKQALGKAIIRVAREGFTGPEVKIDIVDAAPALFLLTPEFIIATDAENALITSEAPAIAGKVIVIYATGLGKTKTPSNTEIPTHASEILRRDELHVTLDGIEIDPADIYYAGVSPGSAGLYQINLRLPPVMGTDPELRVRIGDASSPAGLKLPAHR